MSRPNTRKIASVSVNMDAPPSYEKILELALRSKEFKRMPKRDACKLIAKELKANGFTRTKRITKKKQTSQPETD